MKRSKNSVKKCFNTRLHNNEFYSFIRLPLNYLSFFVLCFLSKFSFLRKPNIYTSFMFIFAILGTFTLFINSFFGILFYIISYFFDLLDGKMARLTKKQNKAFSLLDLFYHSFFSSIFLGFIFLKELNISNYIILFSILVWSLKFYINSIFLFLSKTKKMSKQYSIPKNKFFHFIYSYVLRFFLHPVDIFFGVLFFLLFNLLYYYFIIFLSLNILSLFLSLYLKFIILKNKQK